MLRSLISRLLGRPDSSQLSLEFSAAPRRRAKNPATHRDDEHLARALSAMHATYNDRHFDGRLRAISIRVSRRMRSRLGFYACTSAGGAPPEITINRRHIRRDGWDEALHTLVHEMLHQWQDESGLPVNHGAEFRAKARAVGITPRACRDLEVDPRAEAASRSRR